MFWKWFLMLPVLPGLAAAQGNCWLRDGVSPAAKLVYLLCEQGQMVVTTDGGATWQTRDTGATQHLRNIDFIDANHGFAVGDGGLLLATSDGGRKWEVRQTGVKDNLAAIQFVGQSGWAVGFDGVMLHSADGGKTWSRQESGTRESLEGLYFLDENNGWAVGWAGTILKTTDGGAKWQAIKTDAAAWSLSGVYFRDAKNGWIVGFSGQIIRSRDGGATWQAQKSPVASWLTSIAFDKAGRGWITADDSLLVSEDGGENWRKVPVEDQLFLAQLIPVDGSLWAMGQLGVLRQTGDGLTFKRLETLVADDPTRDTAEIVK
jgi:photosystem II stability/assembly factor-like uncharacterized protein